MKMTAMRTYLLVVATAATQMGGTPVGAPSPADAGEAALPPPSLTALMAVPESEPNDDAAGANSVQLGDDVTGEISPQGDVDYFTFFAQAGTVIDVKIAVPGVSQSAEALLVLYGGDGSVVLWPPNPFGEPCGGNVAHAVQASGDYFLAVYGGTGQLASFTYTLEFRTAIPGPGDPTTTFASGLDYPRGMTFDHHGNLYVTEFQANRVSRLTPQGDLSTFVTSVPSPGALAVDALGSLLVASGGYLGDGTVYRVDEDGTARRFLSGFDPGLFWPSIAIGPDGDIWVADSNSIARFDLTGAFKYETHIGNGPIPFLAFSPDGELHFSRGTSVFKLVDGSPEPVISAGTLLEGFAFDVEGRLYIASLCGGVRLHGSDGDTIDARFSLNGGVPREVAFGRDADGTTNARLFVLTGSAILEANPAGVAAAGWPVAPRLELLDFAKSSIRDGLMGAPYADTAGVVSAPVAPVFSLASGSLPPGLDLDATTGVISGVPEKTGTFQFRLRADADDHVGMADYTIQVGAPELAVAYVTERILGMGLLSEDEERFLDLIGNRNGFFDVGDFRAYLMTVDEPGN